VPDHRKYCQQVGQRLRDDLLAQLRTARRPMSTTELRDNALAQPIRAGGAVTVAPLRHDHHVPAEGLSTYLANLSRNVVLRSENPSTVEGSTTFARMRSMPMVDGGGHPGPLRFSHCVLVWPGRRLCDAPDSKSYCGVPGYRRLGTSHPNPNTQRPWGSGE